MEAEKKPVAPETLRVHTDPRELEAWRRLRSSNEKTKVALRGRQRMGPATPPRGYNRSPAPGAPVNGNANGNGRRHVPGAAPPSHSPSPGPEGEKKSSRKRNKGAKKDGEEKGKKDAGDADSGRPSLDVPVNGKTNGRSTWRRYTPLPQINVDVSPTTPTLDSALDPAAKKIRNLNKKVWFQRRVFMS